MPQAVTKPSSGYRLRDLLAAIAVLQMGSSYLYLVEAGLASPLLDVAILVFSSGLALLIFAYIGGHVVDRLGIRCPGLVSHRHCPLSVLFGIVAIPVALAAREEDVMRWVAEAVGIMIV